MPFYTPSYARLSLIIIPFSSLIYSRESLTFILYISFESYLLLSNKLNLYYFIYYLNFKLLLYSTYKSAILRDYIKGYIFKYLSSYKGEVKVSKAISLVISFLSSLKVESISKSLE
jgi:hypothetical protein